MWFPQLGGELRSPRIAEILKNVTGLPPRLTRGYGTAGVGQRVTEMAQAAGFATAVTGAAA